MTLCIDSSNSLFSLVVNNYRCKGRRSPDHSSKRSKASVLLRSPGNNYSSNTSEIEQFRKESCWGWTSLAI